MFFCVFVTVKKMAAADTGDAPKQDAIPRDGAPQPSTPKQPTTEEQPTDNAQADKGKQLEELPHVKLAPNPPT